MPTSLARMPRVAAWHWPRSSSRALCRAAGCDWSASQSSGAVAGSDKGGNSYTLSFEEYKELFERITAMSKSGSLSRLHEHALYDAIASKDPRISVAFRKVKELNDQSALLALARQRASESN